MFVWRESLFLESLKGGMSDVQVVTPLKERWGLRGILRDLVPCDGQEIGADQYSIRMEIELGEEGVLGYILSKRLRLFLYWWKSG